MPERRNRWLRRMLQGAALLYAVWAAGMSWAEARVALVVGNSTYQHSDSLANPSNDAEDMATQLRRLGFEVIEGRDLTEDGFYDHLRKFSKAVRRAKGGEAALFFYAGHGIQNDEAENYLVPVDVAFKDKWSMRDMVRLDDVMETMEEFSGLKLVFLDACRDNPLRGARTMGGGGKRGLAPATIRDDGAKGESSGTVIVYATAADDTADDGEGRNSPFTGALLEHIGTPGVEIDQMLDRVTRTVIERTRHIGKTQVPWVSKSKIGQFYFVSGSGGAVAEDSGTSSPVPPPPNEARAAYELAEKVHTIKAYEAIATGFPDTVYAALAGEQIRKLTGGDGDVRPESPSGPKAEAEAGQSAEEEARRRRAAVEDAYWKKCESNDSAVYCKDYLAEYEDGAYARMARRRLAEFKEAARRADAKRRTEEEARQRAEAEEKQRTEAEARRRAEEEARRHAEAEERRRAEAEARRRAAAKSKLKEEAADPANLFAAVWAGDIERVKVLLSAGADANVRSKAKDHGNARPLHWAASDGKVGIVNALLASRADPNAATDSGWTPLHWAAWQNQANAIMALTAGGADPNAKDNGGTTVLRLAVIDGHAEAVKALLAGGADGATPMLLRAMRDGDVEGINTLLAGGADPNARDKNVTVLHLAVINGAVEGVKALLSAGANVNAETDTTRNTPLHTAARYGQVEAIRVLLSAGASLNAREWGGGTPLHRAAEYGQVEAIEALLLAGANVHARDEDRATALSWAASDNQADAIEALLSAGANVNARDVDGDTALHYAAINDETNAIEALLAGGARLNRRNKDGKTPLQEAVSRGHAVAARLLRRAGG